MRNSITVIAKKKEEKGDVVLTTTEFAIAAMMNFMTNHHLWCYATGAMSNMIPFIEGLYDFKKIDGNVKIGDGTGLKSTLIGKKNYIAEYKDRMTQNLTLTVKVMLNL